MSLLAKIAYPLLTASPLFFLQRAWVAAKGITVFMYHDIGRDDDDIDIWQVVRRRDFLQQVNYLRQHYDIVSLDEALHAAQTKLPSKPLAVLTFDDGLQGNIQYLLPILERERLPAIIYVATGHVESGNSYWFDKLVNRLQIKKPITINLTEFGLGTHQFNSSQGAENWAKIHALLSLIKTRPKEECGPITEAAIRQIPDSAENSMTPLSPDDVKTLADCPYVTIGAHTNGHEILTQIDLKTAEATITESVLKLRRWTNREINHFAYPAGFYNQQVAELVKRMGFKTSMTTDHGIWSPSNSAHTIPRIAVGRYDSIHTFKINSVRP